MEESPMASSKKEETTLTLEKRFLNVDGVICRIIANNKNQ
jgi:hypothetical protein